MAAPTKKAPEQAHELLEQDRVLATVGVWGTPFNMAIRPYMNEQKVPQLFVAATESAFDDPSHFPWTMGFQASKRSEGLAYAKYILRNKPGAKIAILYARDPSGEEWLLGDTRRSRGEGGGHDRQGGILRVFQSGRVEPRSWR